MHGVDTGPLPVDLSTAIGIVLFCVALGFQEKLMLLLTRPYRLAIEHLSKSQLEEWKKREHVAPNVG